MDKQAVLEQLVSMSQGLGLPERDYVILGEGNTSARVSDSSYLIKASGFQLHGIRADGFVELNFSEVLALINDLNLEDSEVTQRLNAAKVDSSVKVRPSIEASLHAVIYDLCGAEFVGHTHPTMVNVLMCAENGPELIKGRLFPDQIVFCGKVPAVIPYIEPGLPLARLVKRTLEVHLDRYGEAPKTVFMQNHGLIAIGRTAAEVESITAMTVKAARVLIGAASIGAVHFMSDGDIERIHTHPGELYRRKLAGF